MVDAVDVKLSRKVLPQVEIPENGPRSLHVLP